MEFAEHYLLWWWRSQEKVEKVNVDHVHVPELPTPGLLQFPHISERLLSKLTPVNYPYWRWVAGESMCEGIGSSTSWVPNFQLSNLSWISLIKTIVLPQGMLKGEAVWCRSILTEKLNFAWVHKAFTSKNYTAVKYPLLISNIIQCHLTTAFENVCYWTMDSLKDFVQWKILHLIMMSVSHATGKLKFSRTIKYLNDGRMFAF